MSHPSRRVAARVAFVIAVAVAVSSSGAAARPFSTGTRARLDRALHTTFAQTRAPGAIVGVWQGNRAWTATAGTVAPGSRRRPSLNLHTRIGSVTKTFTGTLILELVDQRRLKLSDRISKWFPHVRGASRTTIEELGNMSSGIANYTQDARVVHRFFADPFQVWRPQQLIDAGTRMDRLFAPGHGFAYSNTNTLMLGRIVELVTHHSLAWNLQRWILRPLRMSHTSYPATSRIPAPYWHGYTVQPHESGPVKDATSWSPTFAGAAGQLISTLDDLRTWTRALGRGTLLCRRTQAARLRPNPASINPGRAYLFALGDEHGWLSHSGVLAGYSTQIAYLPSRDISIVVETNADIPTQVGTPAPAIFHALARVLAPRTMPTG